MAAAMHVVNTTASAITNPRKKQILITFIWFDYHPDPRFVQLQIEHSCAPIDIIKSLSYLLGIAFDESAVCDNKFDGTALFNVESICEYEVGTKEVISISEQSKVDKLNKCHTCISMKWNKSYTVSANLWINDT